MISRESEYRLNNLRLQLYKIKLAKLMGEIAPLAAIIHVESLTKQIRLARG